MQTVKLGAKWNFDSAKKQEQVQPRAQFGAGWIAPPHVKEHVRQTTKDKEQQADRRAQFGAGWIAPPHVKEHVRRRTQPK